MQIRKTYKSINPALIYDEIKDFVRKQGITIDQDKLETYSMPGDSSTYIYRGTLTFRMQGKEALRAHIVGIDKNETKLILDTDDELFSSQKVSALEDELNFMLGAFEPKS
jgi:hypothetical protein